MSLEVSWYDTEQTILIATFAKDTTWSDYHNAVDEMMLMATQVNHPIDVIFHDEVGMPAGNPLPHVQLGISKLAKHGGIKCWVAGSRASNGFVPMILKLVGTALMKRNLAMNRDQFGEFTKSLPEAIESIQAARAKTQSVV